MTNAIEASGLVKRFGKTTALAGVDLRKASLDEDRSARCLLSAFGESHT
jgi:hypothetical protein